MCPLERRKIAWQRLVDDLPARALGEIGRVATLDQLPELAEQITTGKIRGRVIVDPNG
jgi:acrylyl-CoA reductase (NADPH)